MIQFGVSKKIALLSLSSSIGVALVAGLTMVYGSSRNTQVTADILGRGAADQSKAARQRIVKAYSDLALQNLESRARIDAMRLDAELGKCLQLGGLAAEDLTEPYSSFQTLGLGPDYLDTAAAKVQERAKGWVPVEGLAVVNGQGEVVKVWPEGLVPSKQSLKDEALEQGKAVLGRLEPDGAGGYRLPIAAPLSIPWDTKLSGAIVLYASGNLLWSILSVEQPAPDSLEHAWLADAEGLLLYRPAMAGEPVRGPSDGVQLFGSEGAGLPDTVREDLQARRAGRVAGKTAGSPVLVGYAPVASEGWTVGVTQPLEKVEAMASPITTDLESGLRVNVVEAVGGALEAESRKVALYGTGAVALALLLGAGLSIFAGMRIARPLRAAAAALEAIAHGGGDLTRRLEATTSDEGGQVARWFNAFADYLQGALTKVSEAASEVERGSAAVSASTSQLSDGAQVQARGSAEVASAVEELTATARTITERAEAASREAGQAGQAAAAGGRTVAASLEGLREVGRVVVETGQSVSELGERSQSIGAVLATIEDIADRTNLLALNAAIEAARAGEHGRGFAVVADEVRKLAENTMRATGEIEQIVKGIQDGTRSVVVVMDEASNRVQHHLGGAAEAEAALEEILAGVEGLGAGFQEIAELTGQQLQAVGDIAGHTERIADVARESEQGLGALTGVLEGLAGQASSLTRLVGGFKL